MAITGRCIYVGMLPFLIALGFVLGGAWHGLARLVRRLLRRKPATAPECRPSALPGSLASFLLAIFAIALLLALGKNTPVFPWLYRYVPTFAMFQAPTRWMLWAEFALALLAALGVAGWRRPAGSALYWTRLGTMGAFAVALGAGLAWYGMREISPTFIRATAMAGLWGLGIGLLSLAAPPDENRLLAEGEKLLACSLPGRGLWRAGWPWICSSRDGA
jgi:hypothetical protein